MVQLVYENFIKVDLGRLPGVLLKEYQAFVPEYPYRTDCDKRCAEQIEHQVSDCSGFGVFIGFDCGIIPNSIEDPLFYMEVCLLSGVKMIFKFKDIAEVPEFVYRIMSNPHIYKIVDDIAKCKLCLSNFGWFDVDPLLSVRRAMLNCEPLRFSKSLLSYVGLKDVSLFFYMFDLQSEANKTALVREMLKNYMPDNTLLALDIFMYVLFLEFHASLRTLCQEMRGENILFSNRTVTIQTSLLRSQFVDLREKWRLDQHFGMLPTSDVAIVGVNSNGLSNMRLAMRRDILDEQTSLHAKDKCEASLDNAASDRDEAQASFNAAAIRSLATYNFQRINFKSLNSAVRGDVFVEALVEKVDCDTLEKRNNHHKDDESRLSRVYCANCCENSQSACQAGRSVLSTPVICVPVVPVELISECIHCMHMFFCQCSLVPICFGCYDLVLAFLDAMCSECAAQKYRLFDSDEIDDFLRRYRDQEDKYTAPITFFDPVIAINTWEPLCWGMYSVDRMFRTAFLRFCQLNSGQRPNSVPCVYDPVRCAVEYCCRLADADGRQTLVHEEQWQQQNRSTTLLSGVPSVQASACSDFVQPRGGFEDVECSCG